jgi:IS4 transposase
MDGSTYPVDYKAMEFSPYSKKSSKDIDQSLASKGIFRDELITLGYHQAKTQQVEARLIAYHDRQSGQFLDFITNDFNSDPLTITELYRRRWDIEGLFKRLKQNMPLNYFLGENQNAIRIQIWCALIADLLLNTISKLVKRQWAFSTLTSLVRLHLFNYLNLYSFLENPDKCFIGAPVSSKQQLKFNFSG